MVTRGAIDEALEKLFDMAFEKAALSRPVGADIAFEGQVCSPTDEPSVPSIE